MLCNSPMQATCCQNSLIPEEQRLHVYVDMYYRVIPSQIITHYASMPSDLAKFCYEFVQQ